MMSFSFGLVIGIEYVINYSSYLVNSFIYDIKFLKMYLSVWAWPWLISLFLMVPRWLVYLYGLTLKTYIEKNRELANTIHEIICE